MSSYDQTKRPTVQFDSRKGGNSSVNGGDSTGCGGHRKNSGGARVEEHGPKRAVDPTRTFKTNPKILGCTCYISNLHPCAVCLSSVQSVNAVHSLLGVSSRTDPNNNNNVPELPFNLPEIIDMEDIEFGTAPTNRQIRAANDLAADLEFAQRIDAMLNSSDVSEIEIIGDNLLSSIDDYYRPSHVTDWLLNKGVNINVCPVIQVGLMTPDDFVNKPEPQLSRSAESINLPLPDILREMGNDSVYLPMIRQELDDQNVDSVRFLPQFPSLFPTLHSQFQYLLGILMFLSGGILAAIFTSPLITATVMFLIVASTQSKFNVISVNMLIYIFVLILCQFYYILHGHDQLWQSFKLAIGAASQFRWSAYYFFHPFQFLKELTWGPRRDIRDELIRLSHKYEVDCDLLGYCVKAVAFTGKTILTMDSVKTYADNWLKRHHPTMTELDSAVYVGRLVVALNNRNPIEDAVLRTPFRDLEWLHIRDSLSRGTLFAGQLPDS
jgi:hypothetical protein